MTTVTLGNNTVYPYFTHEPNFQGLSHDIVNINKTSKGGSFSVSIKGYDNENVKEINYNYLKIEEPGSAIAICGWVEDWTRERNGMFTVNYKIDAFRTYMNKVWLGKQYVSRVSGFLEGRTDIKDPMLKTTGYMKQRVYPRVIAPFVGNILGDTPGSGNFDDEGTVSTRYLVVQVRPRSYMGGVDIEAPVEPSNNPLNPSQYRLYIARYTTRNPNGTPCIRTLLEGLRNMSETSNIVTMYSVPFVNHFSDMLEDDLILRVNDKPEMVIKGFKAVDKYDNLMYYQKYNETITVASSPLKGDKVQLISPEGQVLEVPANKIEFRNPLHFSDGNVQNHLQDTEKDFEVGYVPIERIVDLYSGIVTTHIGHGFLTPNSIRTGPLGDITILSDPKETYKAQNKNAIAVGLLSDVVSVAGVLAAPATGGTSLMATAGAMGNTAQGLVSSTAAAADAGNGFTNSPLFMGETIAPLYNNIFHVVVSSYENSYVGKTSGLPYEKIVDLDNLEFYNQYGYIETNNCKVVGGVPAWAADEINGLFNAGIHFSTNFKL